jgi:hypothetical protein
VPLLVDSGVLYALFDKNDAYHSRAVECFRKNRRPLVCNAPVITEVTYLLGRWCSIQHQLIFLEFLQQPGWIIANLDGDLVRIAEIMNTYRDLPADFTDAALIALAERLNCTDILSVDRRGFHVYQPRHVERLNNLFFES